MWWVNKFGNVSGPYSEEQIRKLVQTNRLTRLCKISENRSSWTRLDESVFWGRVASAPADIEISSAVLPGLDVGDGGVRGKTTAATMFSAPVADEVGTDEVEMARGQPPMHSLENTTTRELPVRPPMWKRYAWVGLFALIVVSLVGVGITVRSVLNLKDRGKEPPAGGQGSSAEGKSKAADGDGSKRDKPSGDGVAFESIKRKVVIIRTAEGSGSGFFLKMGGTVYLVTNEHVIRSGGQPKATLIDGSDVALGEFSIAEDRDLARYEVLGDHEYFVLADGSPNNDDPIWVFGNSSGDGVVTTLRGHVTGVGGMTLKIDAEIVGGNSGSPIVNAEGRVVGIASYLKNGSNGKDWTTRDTEFDQVRRFGLRFTGVRWLGVEKKAFAEECGRMAAFETYYALLLPYLRCMDVSDEELATLKLEQKDIDRKRFGDYDEGFHDMLVDLSQSFDGKGRSWVGWMSVMSRRDAVIKELDAAISSNDLTYENAVKALDEFDRKNDITRKWEKVKDRNRAFIAKRKEALMMARSFLSGHTWHDPRMRRGDADGNWCSIDWYLEAIAYWLDQNTQKLKDVNAALKQLERGNEDED